MTELARVPAGAPNGEVIDALAEEGAVIVEGLLDAGCLARCNAELAPLLADASADHRGRFVNEAVAWFFGARTRHVTGIAGKSRIFASEILPHPVFLAACDSILGPSCASYVLNTAHVLDRGPGSERQYVHRDETVWSHLPAPHPEVQLASVIALVDFTRANGATVVAPGSHRWPADRQPRDEELLPAEMAAGSAVIYLGSTLHAGGANTTRGTWRRGMHVSYCVGWLRTEENQYLAVDRGVVRGLPRRAQELLGYSTHDAIRSGGGYLGAVELQDPIRLLDEGAL